MADKTIKVSVKIQYGDDKVWEQVEELKDPKIPYMREGGFLMSNKIGGIGDKLVPLALKEINEEFPDANN